MSQKRFCQGNHLYLNTRKCEVHDFFLISCNTSFYYYMASRSIIVLIEHCNALLHYGRAVPNILFVPNSSPNSVFLFGQIVKSTIRYSLILNCHCCFISVSVCYYYCMAHETVTWKRVVKFQRQGWEVDGYMVKTSRTSVARTGFCQFLPL